MITVATQDLAGPALDWVVAKCEGLDHIEIWKWGGVLWRDAKGAKHKLRYSTNWNLGGQIIAREKLMIQPKIESGIYYGTWRSVCLSWEGRTHSDMTGATPLVAAMRAFVASKLGHQVEVPEELAP